MAREVGPEDWEPEEEHAAPARVRPERSVAGPSDVARRPVRRRRWPYVVVGLLAVAGGVGAGLFFAWPSLRGLWARPLPSVRLPVGETATLYFADPRSTRLVPETRPFTPRGDVVAQLRALFEALAVGPRSEAAPVLPKGSRLRAAYVGRDGLAVLDLEPWPDGTDLGGASGELLAVSSLVETVGRNVPGVRSVQLLVGGQERETLDGHVKISEPLTPRETAGAPAR